jgi:hypothetical protein
MVDFRLKMKCLEIFVDGFEMSLWQKERASVNSWNEVVTQKSGSTGKEEEEGGGQPSLVTRVFHHFQLL